MNGLSWQSLVLWIVIILILPIIGLIAWFLRDLATRPSSYKLVRGAKEVSIILP